MTIGIVRISPSCLLLLAWLFYQDSSSLILSALTACALHEWGHIFILRWKRISIKQINLTPFGARIEIAAPLSYRQELLSAAAGPAVNLALAYLSCHLPGGESFAGLNLVLALLNLLPIGHLDGARILGSILALAGSDALSVFFCQLLDRIFSAAFSALGLYLSLQYGNLTLLLVSGWLLLGASHRKM